MATVALFCRVPLSGLPGIGNPETTPHCWTSQQWHTLDSQTCRDGSPVRRSGRELVICFFGERYGIVSRPKEWTLCVATTPAAVR